MGVCAGRFGGGNLLARNIIFNACRESGDHGPFNR